ncbi:MAG: fatty acid desaturase [Fibrobacterota bacterium]|nr:fatty acid desaturase [Fibrobacterota bacterium]
MKPEFIEAGSGIPTGQIAAIFSDASKRKTNLKGIVYSSADLLLYYGSVFAIVWFQETWVKLAFSLVVIPILLSRLFVLGHDLGHKILAENKTLNAVFGRLVFIPTFHTYSLWELYHNIYHHGFSNIRKKDYSWAPLSPTEFLQASLWKRLIYRMERSVPGHGIWVIAEHILPRMFFPKEKYIDRKRPIYTVDSLLVLGANAVLGILAICLANFLSTRYGHARMDAIWVVCLTIVFPWLIFSWLLGWMIFIQHTGTDVPWYTHKTPLSYLDHQKTVTPDWIFPYWFGWLFHFIHVHTAHHVNAKIPAYNLNLAQSELLAKSPEHILSRRWTIWIYFETVRKCKLFDFEKKHWCDFSGRQTGPVLNYEAK